MVLDGGKAPTRCTKLWVERQPFLASKPVIFIDFTGPHIRFWKTAELPAYRGSEPVSGEEPGRVVFLTPRPG